MLDDVAERFDIIARAQVRVYIAFRGGTRY